MVKVKQFSVSDAVPEYWEFFPLSHSDIVGHIRKIESHLEHGLGMIVDRDNMCGRRCSFYWVSYNLLVKNLKVKIITLSTPQHPNWRSSSWPLPMGSTPVIVHSTLHSMGGDKISLVVALLKADPSIKWLIEVKQIQLPHNTTQCVLIPKFEKSFLPLPPLPH